ncbi:MAG: HlyD family type I secretion periplasmic adaptor subunit [Pseudomonadota bacterium]
MMQMQLPGDGGSAAQDKEAGWNAGSFIRFGMICVLVLGCGFGGWAATASLAGAVVATGQLRVEANKQVVQHPDGGVVEEILVREGDRVAAGQVLIRLDSTTLQSELAGLESQLFEIIARRGRLEAVQLGLGAIEFDPELLEAAAANREVEKLRLGQEALLAAQRDSMATERNVMGERQQQLAEQIAGAEREGVAMTRQVELIGQELVDMKKLLRQKLVPASRVLALEREEARLQGEAGQLLGQIASLKGQISEIDIELLRMDATMLEEAISESRELGFRELELKERRLSLRERLDRLDIRAPMNGVVLDNTVFALQSVVRPAEPILYVVPSDAEMVIDAQVDPVSIDSVYKGQDTVLRFSAFNTRTTPELFGNVTNLALDTTTDEQTGLTYYKTEVALQAGELGKLEGLELIAGMPVEVYIQTGERTPFQYLLKPITDYFERAWNEE